MSPEQLQRIALIFMGLFTDDWVEAFETLCRVGLDDRNSVGSVEEQIAMLDDNKKGFDGKPLEEEYVFDTLRDAKIFFQVNWQLFKQICAEKRLILIEEDAVSLISEMMPCKEVWETIVTGDTDFLQFQKIARHNEEDEAIESAKTRKESALVAKLERKQAVRRAIESNMLRSKDPNLPLDRLKVPFSEELEATIVELEMEGVPSGPKEMSEMLTELYPHTKPIHTLLNQYIPRFKALKENPTPKLKKNIFEKVATPETIKINLVEIDSVTNTLKFCGIMVQITPEGIREVLTLLRDRKDIQIQEFQSEVTNVLKKIREFCQINHIAGLKQLFYKQQKSYQKMWLASDRSSEDSLKIGFILAALGLIHADMAEVDRGEKAYFRKQG